MDSFWWKVIYQVQQQFDINYIFVEMLLMTVGGSNNEPNTKKYVKLYSLSGDFSVPSCLQNLADLLINRVNAAGATLGPGLYKHII